MLSRLFTHPLLRKTNLTDIETIEIRRRLINEKPLLKAIYQEWYELIVDQVKDLNGVVIELGSGPGFLEKHIPRLIKSDIYYLNNCHAVVDGISLPFRNESVAAFTMTNVSHHIREARVFLHEASRCLEPGGKIIMIEPWSTTWSRFIYKRFHPEPFDDQAKDWKFYSDDPLKTSNQAMPWIIFERDRVRFVKEFPELNIAAIQTMMPFRYLLSGGVSMLPLTPAWLTNFWSYFENTIIKRQKKFGLFALIVLQKLSL